MECTDEYCLLAGKPYDDGNDCGRYSGGCCVKAMKQKRSLAQVDPEGRLDVLLYQFVGKLMDKLERERGVTGFREHLLPIVEQAIVTNFPGYKVIPPEIAAVLKVYQSNRRVQR